MLSFDIVSLDIASLDIVSLDIVSFDMLSFFIASLDIASFDIVSFFIASSAKAVDASASPNDKVAADRMSAVRLIMTLQSPQRAFSVRQLMSPSRCSKEAVACYALGKTVDHKGVSVHESREYTVNRSLAHRMSPFAPRNARDHSRHPVATIVGLVGAWQTASMR